MVRSVKMQGAHQVDIVRVKSRLAQERRKDIFDKLYALVGRVYLFGIVFVKLYKAVPNIALVGFRPCFHFVNFFLRYHTVLIKYARAFLQIL